MRSEARRGWRRKVHVPALMVCSWLCASSLTQVSEAQDRVNERSRALQSIGIVKPVDLSLFPLESGVGVVFRHEFNEIDASSLRLHFTTLDEGHGWDLKVFDETGEVAWSIGAHEAPDGGFWSDEILGSKAVVEIVSAVPVVKSLKLKVDKLIVGKTGPTPVSTVGPNQLAPIGQHEPWLVELGRSVVRLRFAGDDGRQYVCTAFLLTHSLLLTNEHCIATRSEMLSALVDFDYDVAGSQPHGVRLIDLVETSSELDYSVVRLAHPADRSPLPIGKSRPSKNQDLIIVQHPGGQPKQVSLDDCKVTVESISGLDGSPTDFGHSCDTLGGSSGSPIFDLQARTVVGLHHLGFREGSPNPQNKGVHIDLVMSKLTAATQAEIRDAVQ